MQLYLSFPQCSTTAQVVNVYMAKAPSGTDVANFAGDGAVWFKVRDEFDFIGII